MATSENEQSAFTATGAVGRKYGMSRIFTDSGTSVPVTLVAVDPNRITQVKTLARDGYPALQVTTGERRATRVNRPLGGHFSKAGTRPGRGIWEFRLTIDSELKPGDEIGLEQFSVGQRVDVTAKSKGKGFAGVVKRWNFSTQDFTHGNSLSHRAPGSIGQCQTPGRVFKGKKMAGQMGNARVTTQNLEIVAIDAERKLLFIKGSVPGFPGSDVVIRPAVKVRTTDRQAS